MKFVVILAMALATTFPARKAVADTSGPSGMPSVDQPTVCEPVPTKPPAKKKRKKKPPAPPSKPCACPPGERGPEGPEGPPGPPGERGEDGREGSHGGIIPRIGVMGSAFTTGDWAWGPALQFTSALNRKYELMGEIGVNLIADEAEWSPGRERGLMLHVSLTRYVRPWLGLTAGLYSQTIKGRINGPIDGDYFGLTGGLVLRKRWSKINLRAEIAPFLGSASDTADPADSDLGLGLTGAAHLGYNW